MTTSMITKILDKEITYRLLNALLVLFVPSHWLSNYPTCWTYDKALRDALDNTPDINLKGWYEAEINGEGVWIENWPYSYGRLYPSQKNSGIYSLPCSLTRRKLRKALKPLHAREKPMLFKKQ